MTPHLMSPTPTPSPRILSVPPEPCPVYATSPMLAPCTVTDVEPVPARLPLRRAMLSPAHVQSTMPSDSHSRTSISCRHHHPSGAPSSVSHHAPHRCLRLPLRRLASCLSLPSLVPYTPPAPCSPHAPSPMPSQCLPGCPFDAPCSVPPGVSIDHALRLTLPHLDPLPSSPPVGCPELRVPPCTSSMSPTPTLSPRILSVPPEPCPVYATSPMLAPCTVTDAEPVPARLPLRRAMLSPAMYLDRPCPQTHTPAPRSPAVITTRRVPRAPCPTMHLIDVSDSHSVASHPDLSLPRPCPYTPPAPCSPHAPSPMPSPCPARLPLRRAMLSPAHVRTDQPSVTLYARTSIPCRDAPPVGCPELRVCTMTPHQMSPTPTPSPRILSVPPEPCPVYATSPMLAPCTVTDVEPVPSPVAPSTRHAQSRPCPIDHALRLTLPHLDPLPSSPPVGCPELRVPPCTSSMSPTPTPSPRILSVPPEPCPVYATSPMLAPCTVTDAEPVPARLPLRRAMLSPAMYH